MPSDCIHINGLRAYGYTGALPEEQVLGQWFEVSFTVWLDLSKAGQSDRLDDTYDYRTALTAIQQLIQTSRFNLIERLAEAIADVILTSSSLLHQVQVRVTKLAPPIPGFAGSISVEIIRHL
jgi:dihydroneopterin aldolase